MTLGPQENIILDGSLLGKLRADVEDIFRVDSVETPRQAPQGTILFLGDLLMRDSEAAYDRIAERWYAHQYTPLLRRRENQIALIAQPGIVTPKPSNPWINLAWFIATIISVLFIGAIQECQCDFPVTLTHWLSGFPMMLTIMSILLAHEFGHYFAARHHKIAVTLPYFIPLPIPPFSLVGTLGAFIQLRTPFKTKKQLFDIGVAGPLAGLVIAIPLVFWGVANSPIQEITRGQSALEGNSIFYLIVKLLTHGQLLPSFDQYANLPLWQEFPRLLVGIIPPGAGVDVFVNSATLAAWYGLLITAINLMPVGQLDGGHVVYCLLGEKAQKLSLILVGVMLFLGFVWWLGWLVWGVLVLVFVGPGHPPPLNDLVELGWPRRVLAYLVIVIFIILFIANPLQAV